MKRKRNAFHQNNKLHHNNHHIIPQSRLKGRTVIIPIVNHNIYHTLFSNMTPPEIIEFLNKNFWGDCYQISIEEK